MLTKEQIENIKYVYNNFMQSDNKVSWTRLDTLLEILEWLDDLEIYKEAECIYSYQKNKKMGCRYTHVNETRCFALDILEAVESIIELYKKTENLHPKNRYILANYLALCQDGQIVEIAE